ncbi:MAG: hypothetical protein EOO01_27145, partial [Chitinophagaceae bacterium]
MVLSKLFTGFFESERAAGLTLVACTALSLIFANIFPGYAGIWNAELGSHTLVNWINDGLMAIFFLLIGLELEREIYAGELSSTKAAMLPISAALGGILLPAALYTIFNYGTPLQKGAGIPMATDIAFAVGILSLLGKRVPAALKVFITAFAIADDIGAIANNPDISVMEGNSSTIYYMGANVRNEALSNPKVIEAMKYLIDYQGIADTIGRGTIKVHQTMIPDGFLGGNIDYNPYSFDLEKAKALLAESGVSLPVTLETVVWNVPPYP